MKKRLAVWQARGAPSGGPAEWQEFMPLAQASRDGLALGHHVQLEALRMGAGSMTSLRLLMRVVLASAMLHQLGYGRALPAAVEDYETLARDAMDGGTDGAFAFGAGTFGLFAGAVLAFDQQLRTAPLKALRYVGDQLENFAKAS